MVGLWIRMGEGALVTPHPFFCVDAFELPSPARGASQSSNTKSFHF
jgi:hypothetical protein